MKDTEMGQLFESIKRGMEEAIAHSKGEKTDIRPFVSEVVNEKRVSEQYGKRVEVAKTFT